MLTLKRIYFHSTKEIDEDKLYLCVNNKGDIFSSRIKYNNSFGHYVDNVRVKEAIPVSELDELYEIEREWIFR